MILSVCISYLIPFCLYFYFQTSPSSIYKLIIPNGNASQFIKKIIKEYNTKLSNPAEHYENYRTDYVIGRAFNLQIYSQKKNSVSEINEQYILNNDSTENVTEVTINQLLFYYSESQVYVRTMRNSRNVIKRYIDYSFPLKMAKNLCELKNTLKNSTTNLLGNEHKSTRKYIEPERMKCEPVYIEQNEVNLRENASIRRLKCFKGITNIRVAYSTFCIKFKIGFTENNYFEIIRHLNEINEGNVEIKTTDDNLQTEDENYDSYALSIEGDEEVLNELDQQFFDMLENCMKNKSSELTVDFSFRNSENFYSYTEFRLMQKKKLLYTFTERPTLKEILEHLGLKVAIEPVEDFKSYLNSIKVEYGTDNSKKLLNLIEGNIYYENQQFWRLSTPTQGTKWYCIQDDYFRKIETEKYHCLNKYLMPLEHEAQLPHAWEWSKISEMTSKIEDPKRSNSESTGPSTSCKRKATNKLKIVNKKKIKFDNEKIYNEKYLKTEGFIIGDRSTQNTIEVFDLMFSSNSTPKHYYLYHVKKDFRNTMRVACGQLLDAIDVTRGAIQSKDNSFLLNFFNTLRASEYYKDNLQNFDILQDFGNFKKIFEGNNYTFVCALQTNKYFRSSSKYTELSTLFLDCTERWERRSLHLEKLIRYKVIAQDLIKFFDEITKIDSSNYGKIAEGLCGDKNIDKMLLSEKIIGMLKNKGYINKRNEVNQKLSYATQKAFIESFDEEDVNGTLKKECCTQLFRLLGPYRTLFPSLPAKLNLIRTVEIVTTKYGKKMLICDIFGKKKTEAEKPAYGTA